MNSYGYLRKYSTVIDFDSFLLLLAAFKREPHRAIHDIIFFALRFEGYAGKVKH